MTDIQLQELNDKLDKVLAALPTIDALGMVLVQQSDVARSLGIARNSIQQSKKVDKLDEFAHRRTYIEIGQVLVLKRPKGRKSRVK